MEPASGKLREQELRVACAKLERRLRSGEACRAETLFAEYPLLVCQEDAALDLIYAEFITREELGQKPTPEEFFARFPQWRSRLQQQFNIHEWLSEDELPAGAALPGTKGPGNLQFLGDYEIQEEIGRGRFGVVYKAWQKGLQRQVAVKVPAPQSNLLLASTQEFCREARVMAGLQHPHIMPVHDIGEEEGLVYFSMNYAAGGSLAQALARRRKLAASEAAELLRQVGGAIAYAHQKGVIHLDLKPSNILFDDQGRPLVSDFGLAHLQNTQNGASTERALGTPVYMAPEQVARDAELTPAVDVWALGVILYELVCGVRPFEKKSRASLFRAITRQAPPIPRRHTPDLDPRLESICLKCLAKEPAARFASVRSLVDELAAIQRS